MRKWFGTAWTLVQMAFLMAILAPGVVWGIWSARRDAKRRAKGR